VQLYQQEVSALKEQVQVAQEGQENILQRFNSNRDKQEQENNKVRETIKFLRDENHELTSASSSQAAEFKEQINELEHKLTEYRLKFEYAQKQLSN
jgi:beta-phosphoglucomutase-like phosphatase (HAD superfamily)